MCGAKGDSNNTNVSNITFGLLFHFVAALMNSIIADIAVLNRMPSISSVTCKAHKMISNE
jgi:hypothetical protein